MTARNCCATARHPATGAIVPVFNVDGISAGQLDHRSLAASTRQGNEVERPAIAAINPELKLPDLKIQVVSSFRRIGRFIHLG